MNENLLISKTYKITDKISMAIPTVGEILGYGENKYYNIVSSIMSTPYDFMVQLDDIGVDYESITDYDLFMYLFQNFSNEDTSLIFNNLDLRKFRVQTNIVNNEIALRDEDNDITIDRFVYSQICDFLRKLHYSKKPIYKAANKEAKAYIIERTRKKQKRQQNKPFSSQITDSIIALVNNKEFKYDYETVMDLNIFKFNSSVHQIIRKINYDQTMIGCYTGNIDMKTLDMESIHWMNVD